MTAHEKNIIDQQIQSTLVERLTHDPKIDPLKMHVDVTDGKVVLKGTVDTEEEKLRAENIARSIPGVVEVENHLHIGLGVAHALSSLAAQISSEPKEEKDEKKKD